MSVGSSDQSPISSSERPWRILVIHWGNNGGGPKFSLDMANALSTMSNVDVISSFSAYADNAADWHLLPGARLPVRTYRSTAGFALGAVRWFRAVLALRRFIREHEVKVVYSGMLSLWQSLALPFTIPRGVTYISSIHDAIEHPGDEHILKRIARRKELKRADMVAVYSRHAEVGVQSQVTAEKKIIRLRIGADSSSTEPRMLVPGQEIVLGFFGRIVEYKGIGLFVDAVRILRLRGLNVKGAVYGRGDFDPAIVEASSEFVDWHLRWIDKTEVPGIFQGIDILILPYKEASQSAVLTQAIGYGVPVVATPVGGLAEQVLACKAGLLSESLEAEDLANSIETLLSDEAAYVAYSAAGLNAAKTHMSWHAVATELVVALSEQSKERPGPSNAN